MKILILGIISCAIFCTCHPENCPDELLYELPFTLLNPSDTISVGDTLWYESKFDNVLYDENGQIRNVFEDYDFSFVSCILTRIDSTKEQGGGFDLDIINAEGSLKKTTFSDGYDFYDLGYKYTIDSNYYLKFGLVVNEPGLFVIRFIYLDTQKKVETSCKSHYVRWAFLLNEKDTNFDMLQYSPQSFWQKFTLHEWIAEASYCLYVKP